MDERTRVRAPRSKKKKARKRPPPRRKKFGSAKQEASEAISGIQSVEDGRLQQYLELLQNLYVSFHRGVSRLCGERGIAEIARAEERVRLKEPGFNPGMLTPGNALLVLDLIE